MTAALVAAALDRPNHPARYEPKYVALAYPNGDVPADTGVCADEIVRIYRAAAGIDLQQKVHEDMSWRGTPTRTNGERDVRTRTSTIAACRTWPPSSGATASR